MRWVGQIVMPLFLGFVAASCTGNSTVSAPRPDDLADASVEITLQSSGDARMMLTLARFDPINTPALAERVARIAFPSAGAVTIDDDRSYSDRSRSGSSRRPNPESPRSSASQATC